MRNYLILSLFALLFFFPFLGEVHLFDWDEINFAECAREMLATGQYLRPQIDFSPFWEKPPIFIWMQAISMHFWGINEYAARFPNAICGLVTILVVYKIGKSLFDEWFGRIWAIAWLGSLLPHLYFRSGIIDPWFNLFIFLGLYGFIRFRWQFFGSKKDTSWWVRYRFLIWGALFLGIGILTKGPVAYLVLILTLIAYWAKYKFNGKGYFKHLAAFSLITALVASVWFLVEYSQNGIWFTETFLKYQVRLFSTPDSGHGGFFGYHFVVLLLGCFPTSVFALSNLWGDSQPDEELMNEHTLKTCERCDFTTWMQLLFWVVLILFSLVQTKIVHYSSLCYFPITYLGALTIWRAMKYHKKPVLIPYLLSTLGILIGLIIGALPFIANHPTLLPDLLQKDTFAIGNLEAKVIWNNWETLLGLFFIGAGVLGTYYWNKNKALQSLESAFGLTALGIFFTLIFHIPKIELYSQNAALEFYESKKNENCIIQPFGFKSFAHLFYSQKKHNAGSLPNNDLENSLTIFPEKNLYFVAKVSNIAALKESKRCQELYRKNGFVFFIRK
jgi:4-amino-4-deoxy-L-arabinose transferase-like glycosyltransferase